MAGINGVLIKRELHTRLTGAAALAGVKIDRNFDGKTTPREYVYFGEIEFEHSYPVSRGGGSRFPRAEVAYLYCYIEVWQPGDDLDAVEDRAAEIDEVLEHVIAADPNLGNLPGVVYGGVAGGELLPETTDAGVGVTLTYRLTFESRLS
jgi:hypothetical protein